MRILVATLFGVVAGGFCATFTFSSGVKFSLILLFWILLNRTVMGFVIGISALKLHWAWNGVLIGLIVGSIFSYWLAMGGMKLALLTPIGNALFGFLIELMTTVVCKLPAARRAVQPKVAA